jgi:limonene 1,2-monooxygenase
MSHRRLSAGIFLPPFHATDEDVTLAMERDFQLVELLDRLGYDEAWIGEHHSGGFEVYGSPELFIAAAAVRTKRIRLGTGVISLPFHHPLMVADRMLQLDHQTRGRAMFGFGPGLLPSDAWMLGIDPETQRDRMAESLDVIMRLLAGERVTVDGSWYTLRDAFLHLRPYTMPRPHVAVSSAVTPSGGQLAGRYGLGMISVAASNAMGFDSLDLNWRIANETAAAHGHVMDRGAWRLMAPFHIAPTRAQALEEVKYGFDKWQNYGYAISPAGGEAIGIPSIEAINEGQKGAVGAPDDAVAVLEKLWAKTGGFGHILLLAHDWADWDATQRSYDLFARYVLPAFEERNAARNESMEWMRSNREELSGRRRLATRHVVDKYFAEHADEQKP